jgi:hypothetical protein
MRRSQKDKGSVPTRVFMSYSVKDAQYARKLREALEGIAGVRLSSTEDMSPGENFAAKIKDAISACDTFFVIITHESARSPWVLQELGAAWALDKTIIPIVADMSLLETLPISLMDRQAILIADLDKPEVLNRAISLVTHTAA